MFENKKRLILIALIIIVIAIVLIIVFSSKNPKKVGYDSLEEKLKTASELYYESNKKLLPKEDGDESSVTIKKLVSEEYIKPLDELVENGEKCNGEVVVKNINGSYSYIPYLNCGKDYKTIKMYDKILEDNETVDTGVGLYVDSDSYIFRGEVENNYLKVGSATFRIMGLNNDNSIKIIYSGKSNKSVYDDRFNSDKDSNYGKNDYTISRIYDNLKSFVEDESIFSTDFMASLVKTKACISPRGVNDEDNSMNIECENSLSDEYATLITPSEYLKASLDKDCKNSTNNECQNYNYLSKFDDNSTWWSITPDKDTSYKAYQISPYGTMSLVSCYSTSGIRPIFNLSGDTTYKGGDGTVSNPYVIFSDDVPELD